MGIWTVIERADDDAGELYPWAGIFEGDVAAVWGAVVGILREDLPDSSTIQAPAFESACLYGSTFKAVYGRRTIWLVAHNMPRSMELKAG